MHQVRYFLAVCDSGSFTRAAEHCHVSQPALTVAIKKLEKELGDPLFHRERGRVLLTNLGQLMRPHLEQLACEANAAREVADNYRRLNKVPLKIGVMITIGPMRLGRLLAEYQRNNPGVELAVHEGDLDGLSAGLDANDLDLAVLNLLDRSEDNFRSEVLYTEGYRVLLPPGHRLEAKQGIGLGDLSGEPYVDRLACEMRDLVVAACQDRDIELYAAFRSEREDWIQGMVLAGLGFAFMPEHSITLSDIPSRPLVDPVVERTISLVGLAGRRHSPAVEAFRQAARSHQWLL
jgi:DNA-binding transcriptional LysR family regulator